MTNNKFRKKQFGDKSVTLAVMLQVAHYFIEWPHLTSASKAISALLTNPSKEGE